MRQQTPTADPVETPFFFLNENRSLFGILHEPAPPGSKPSFVFCHPFGEEKLWTHRAFVSLARHLAAQGHAVLRFDFMGNGDSSGDFSQSSLATACSDVRCAIQQVRRMTAIPEVSLFGLRLGATIASLAAEETPDVRHLVLWAPIVDGGRYMQELLRSNLTTQMATYKEIRHDREALVASMNQGKTVNVDGYELALPLFAEVSAVKLDLERKRHQGPCLVGQIDRQPGRPSGELQRLAASYERATVLFAQEEPFWKEILPFYSTAPNLASVTSEWMSAQ